MAEGVAANEAELMEQLSKERLARNELKAQLDRLTQEHNKCEPLIAALRKQMKETKEALDLEDLQQLEDTKVKAVQESRDLERQLAKPRVKLGAAAPGGAAAPALPLPAVDSEAKAVVQDKKLGAGTLTGIASLRQELVALKKAHAPCEAALASKDDKIKELMAHVQRLDKKLAEEILQEEALAKKLAEELRKDAELEK